MQSELKALQREIGIAFLFVTHDQEEAMALSDRIALLRAGELEQVSTPRDLYNRPRTAYAASFVGQTNLLEARVENGIAHAGSLQWPSALPDAQQLFSLRPEHISIVSGADAGSPNSVRFRGLVRRQVFHGASDLLEVQSEGGQVLLVRLPNARELAGELLLEFAAANAIPLRH